MEQVYKVVKDENFFVVRAKGNRENLRKFPFTLDGYLRAKFTAHMGNYILAHPEMEFAR